VADNKTMEGHRFDSPMMHRRTLAKSPGQSNKSVMALRDCPGRGPGVPGPSMARKTCRQEPVRGESDLAVVSEACVTLVMASHRTHAQRQRCLSLTAH
jgi:hypothetical protein